MNPTPPRQVLALLDDAAAAADVIELSSTLAQRLQCPLEVVYVESVPALTAAALPFTRVLAAGGMQWQPFAPRDVESGYRAQAARVRELAARVTTRRSVRWSLRTVRGALAQAIVELHAEADLMVVATAALRAPLAAPRGARPRRPAAVTVVTDDSPQGRQAQQLAQQVAQALDGVLTVRHAAGAAAAAAARDRHCDLVVLPRALVAPGVLATLERPALIVG